MTNDFIGNRMAGYEHGAWFPGGAKFHGKGAALHKVCPQHQPFGIFKGNVFHDSGRFGLYLDNQYPRKLVRDADGFVVNDRESQGFTSYLQLLLPQNSHTQTWITHVIILTLIQSWIKD